MLGQGREGGLGGLGKTDFGLSQSGPGRTQSRLDSQRLTDIKQRNCGRINNSASTT